ncbi:MAG: hypothetical protein QM731_21670 [Chitinophagaceae bacterium]
MQNNIRVTKVLNELLIEESGASGVATNQHSLINLREYHTWRPVTALN